MKTAKVLDVSRPIEVVVPPTHSGQPECAQLSELESKAIAAAITPEFDHYANQYDTSKYWPELQ